MKAKSICVIGTGIGASSFLKSIEKKIRSGSVSIVILEAGGKAESELVTYESVGRDFGIRTTRAIKVGGTSNLWHGVLSPLDKSDFSSRSVFNSSGWPISREELVPYYDDAASTLGLKFSEYFEADKIPANIKSKSEDICFNRLVFKNKIFQQPLPAMNFKSYIFELSKLPNVTLMTEAPALKFEVADNSVKSVTYGLPSGETGTVAAEIFVVSAGALETPRLLLNSGMTNEHIGRYLMDHPMGNLCQVKFRKPQKAPLYSDFKLLRSQKIKSGLVIQDNIREKLGLLNHCFYFRPSFVEGVNDESEKLKLSLLAFRDGKLSWRDVWKLLLNFNVIRQILVYKLSLNVTYKYADLFLVSEQTPTPESCVCLSTRKDKWGYPIAKVNWQINNSDIRDVRKWFDLIRESLFDNDEFEFVHSSQDFNWEATFTSAAHHVGTARMSGSARDGVVDKNLRVHGVENLFICDGSVFPTSGNVNSSFTIAALAHRLGRFLIKGNNS